MLHPNYYLLHVADPVSSGAFYADLFGVQPVDSSPTFVLFVLDGGIKFGLWSKATVEPATGGAPGALEIGIPVKTVSEVDAVHAAWSARGVSVLQVPTDMEFGRSFMVTDPDGHRIRVFCVVM
ncbi:VOC family protein [Oryzibacter oryziterrae]|uniref:VOC family protein n=1 Tax=Oryzibacter oryziterrae TaxID=2766474 RepID=UPI001F29B4FF|nr:VOC family protein [Oryzibacter oryziterrae]